MLWGSCLLNEVQNAEGGDGKQRDAPGHKALAALARQLARKEPTAIAMAL